MKHYFLRIKTQNNSDSIEFIYDKDLHGTQIEKDEKVNNDDLKSKFSIDSSAQIIIQNNFFYKIKKNKSEDRVKNCEIRTIQELKAISESINSAKNKLACSLIAVIVSLVSTLVVILIFGNSKTIPNIQINNQKTTIHIEHNNTLFKQLFSTQTSSAFTILSLSLIALSIVLSISFEISKSIKEREIENFKDFIVPSSRIDEIKDISQNDKEILQSLRIHFIT